MDEEGLIDAAAREEDKEAQDESENPNPEQIDRFINFDYAENRYLGQVSGLTFPIRFPDLPNIPQQISEQPSNIMMEYFGKLPAHQGNFFPDPIHNPEILGINRPYTHGQPQVTNFIRGDGSVVAQIPNDPYPLVNTFTSWITPLANSNPGTSLDLLLAIGLQDIQRIRHEEVRYMLRGGSYNPDAHMEPGADWVTLKPLGESNFIHIGSDGEIRLRYTPPIVSQVPWNIFTLYFGDTKDIALAAIDETSGNEVARHMLEGFHESHFKLLDYLLETFQSFPTGNGPTVSLMLRTNYMVVDLANTPITEGSKFWLTTESIYTDRNYAGCLWQHFKAIQESIEELVNQYHFFKDNEGIGSVWFANWSIQVPEIDDPTSIHQAFSFYPIQITQKTAFRVSILSAGMCLAETFWWIAHYTSPDKFIIKSVLEDGRSKTNFAEVRCAFVRWLYTTATQFPLEYERWARGDVTLLKAKFYDLRIRFQMIDLEAATLTLGIPDETFPIRLGNRSVKSWIGEYIDPFAPVLVFSQHHIFEVKYGSLAAMLRNALPNSVTWVRNPWETRDEHFKKRQRRKTGEKVEFKDIAFDIEAYTTPCGIQVPYLAVLSEMWAEGVTHVFRKTSPTHDLMNDIRFYLWDRYNNPIEGDPNRAGRFNPSRKNKPRIEYRFWAYNGCHYDFPALIDSLLLESAVFLGECDSFKMIRWGSITFLDFCNFVKGKLDDVALAWLGEGKLEHPPFEVVTPETWPEYQDVFEPYCRRDTQLLGMLVLKFLESLNSLTVTVGAKTYTLDQNTVVPTASSLAMKAFKQLFLTKEVYPVPQDLYPHCKEAYLGGMTMALKQEPPEDIPVLVYDVNSLYPSVMKKYLMPTKFVTTSYMSSPILLANFMKYKKESYGSRRYLYMYRVTSWKCKDFMPFWHLAQKVKGQGLFYTSTFAGQTWRWDVELEGLEEYADIYIDAYHQWLGEDIFSEFVDFFYARKAAAKEAGKVELEALMKLILNSLYGKTGQKQYPEIWTGKLGRVYDILKKRGKLGEIKSVKKLIGDFVMVKTVNQMPINHDGGWISISGRVTAGARRTMLDLALETMLSNIPSGIPLTLETLLAVAPLYMDTDSLFFPKTVGGKPFKIANIGKSLGQLKLEKEFTKLIVLGSKVYYGETADGKVTMKAKGIPAGALTQDLYFGATERDGAHFRQPFFTSKEFFQIRHWQFQNVALNSVKRITRMMPRRKWISPRESHMFPTLGEALEEIVRFKKSPTARNPVEKKLVPEDFLGVFDDLEKGHLDHEIMSRQCFQSYPAHEFTTHEEFLAETRALAVWFRDMGSLVRIHHEWENPNFILGCFNHVYIDPEWISEAHQILSETLQPSKYLITL